MLGLQEARARLGGMGEAWAGQAGGMGDAWASQAGGKGDAWASQAGGKGEASASQQGGKGEASASQQGGKGDAWAAGGSWDTGMAPEHARLVPKAKATQKLPQGEPSYSQFRWDGVHGRGLWTELSTSTASHVIASNLCALCELQNKTLDATLQLSETMTAWLKEVQGVKGAIDGLRGDLQSCLPEKIKIL